MARALVHWLLIYARSDRVCANFEFGQAAENQSNSYILREQREGAKIVLYRSIAGLFGSCNYIFALTICYMTFVEGTLLKCSFVDGGLVGGNSIDALYCAIKVLESRVLVRWSAEKQLSESCAFDRVVCRCSLTFVFFVFVKKLKGAR